MRRRDPLGGPFRARLIAGIAATLAMLLLMFGIDVLDSFFLQTGVSALDPIRRAMSESLMLRFFIVAGWGYFLFDMALATGIAMAVSPYNRLIRSIRMVPSHMSPFLPREGDDEIKPLADALNGLMDRMALLESNLIQMVRDSDRLAPEEMERRITAEFRSSRDATPAAETSPARRIKRRLIQNYTRKGGVS